MKVAVFGAGVSAGINFIRAISSDYVVVGIDPNKELLELSGADRLYTAKGETLEQVLGLCKKEKVRFIHAQIDSMIPKLASWNSPLKEAGVKTFLPSLEAVRLCQDKLAFMERLEASGVPHPKTVPIDLSYEISGQIAELGRPVWVRNTTSHAGSRAILTDSTPLIREWVKANPGRWVASEYLPGADYSWVSLWKDGRLVTSQGKKRLQWLYPNASPIGAGTTAVQVTVSDGELNSICTRAVKAVSDSPNGLFTVDCREDKDGRPRVTEINAGRFHTASLLYAKAGVNLPLIYVRLAFGHDPDLPMYNCLPEGLYWVRHVDVEPRLIKEGGWSSTPL